jgi:hypothetical protein
MPLPSGGDYDLDSGLSGLLFRGELNALIAALLSLNSSASLPPDTVAFMLRADLSVSPNELQIRNPSDAAFLKIAEVTDTEVTLFSDGAAVPSLGSAQTFTEAQTIDQASSAGLLSIGSDLSTGVVARIPLFGHNSSAANVTGVNLVCRLNTNTAAAEDFTFESEVVRGGASVTVATLGSISDFRRSGGGGILDADTLRQAGVTLNTIIDNERSRLGNTGEDYSFTAARTLAQSDQGDLLQFDGSTNRIITVPSLATNTVISLVNDSDGAADLTFVSAAGPNDVTFLTSRLTLPGVSGEAPVCSLLFFGADGDRVQILGDNV